MNSLRAYIQRNIDSSTTAAYVFGRLKSCEYLAQFLAKLYTKSQPKPFRMRKKIVRINLHVDCNASTMPFHYVILARNRKKNACQIGN